MAEGKIGGRDGMPAYLRKGVATRPGPAFLAKVFAVEAESPVSTT
jgi:hypothetical protein